VKSTPERLPISGPAAFSQHNQARHIRQLMLSTT
jgi:hypothetical protein